MLNTFSDDGRMPSCAVGQSGPALCGTPGPGREALSPQQEACVRQAILLVEEFRSDCRSGADARLLSVELKATIRCAHQLFSGGFRGECASPQFADDSNACLADLQRMYETLTSGAKPPPFELAHAMDALIIQLARIKVFTDWVPTKVS